MDNIVFNDESNIWCWFVSIWKMHWSVNINLEIFFSDTGLNISSLLEKTLSQKQRHLQAAHWLMIKIKSLWSDWNILHQMDCFCKKFYITCTFLTWNDNLTWLRTLGNGLLGRFILDHILLFKNNLIFLSMQQRYTMHIY